MRSSLLCLLLVACVGDITTQGPLVIDPFGGTGGGGSVEVPAKPSFACDPASKGTVTPLRRLSALQYKNTLKQLFSVIPGFDATAQAQAPLAALPVDQVELTFHGMDSRLSEGHVQGYYDVADALTNAIAGSDTTMRALAGTCALSAIPAPTCINTFLDGFARRAYRRPLTAEERTRYTSLNDGTRDGRELFRAITFSLIMSPQFLYTAEVQGAALDGTDKYLQLDAYELASRLSYHFWQSMPDDALLDAAKDGSLATDDGFKAQLDRVIADPRTRATIADFYTEWFEIGRINQFPTSTVFTAFAQGTTIGQTGADHLAAAADELTALTDHFTWNTKGTVKDLLTSDLSFTRSTHLAALYGVQSWSGTGAQPTLPAERAGLLTRMGMLVSGTHTTHPIRRGAVVRRRIMCDELTQPSAGALPPGSLVPPPPDASMTTRQRFANKVLNEPCASCHKQMNPIGYVLEQYDAIGRFRTFERVLDDTTGMELNRLPVDSSAAPEIVRGDTTTVSGGLALSQAVADSGKMEACFARQYFRFTYHRFETTEDGCALERVRAALGPEVGSLEDALIAIAKDQSFRTRRVE